MKKRAMAIAAAFALTMSMGMGAAAKDDLVIAEMMDCGTLAPTGPTVEMRSDITYQVYEGLFRYGYNMEMTPQLATSWEQTDPTHITFHLREGVKYHDGRDFTAKDVLFTLKLNCEDANTSGVITYLDLDNCEAPDDYTVILAFTQPNAFNLTKLGSLNIVNEEAYNALKQMYDDLYKNTKKRFLVTSAYKSYDVLNLEENTSQAGYSEFQLGTSVSLKVNGIKDVEFVSTDVYQWLLEHSYEYGYVLRYPSDKVTITQKESCNIFRYVGKENAQKMHNQNLCLEELNNQ